MEERTLHSQAHEKALDQFILCWGEMASAWGINKTMAQIHALLFAEGKPLDTDQIMERLSISRGNANMNLRNLMQWGIVSRVHIKGQRKDYYTAEQDVWNTAAKIIKERQQREVNPIKDNLKNCLHILNKSGQKSTEEAEFADKMHRFIEFLDLFQRFTGALLPYVSQKNMKSLNRFVALAETRNLLRSKPKEVLPYPPQDWNE